jgi:hypothetical protein
MKHVVSRPLKKQTPLFHSVSLMKVFHTNSLSAFGEERAKRVIKVARNNIIVKATYSRPFR